MLRSFYLHKKSSEACIKIKSAPALLLFKDLVTEHRTVKWSIKKLFSIMTEPRSVSLVNDGTVGFLTSILDC